MISINNQGKIDLITDNSGHYGPEPLGMYRGITQLPPGAFAENARIELHDGPGITMNDFIKDMEQVIDGKAKHDILRDQRINKLKEYKQNLKNIFLYKPPLKPIYY